jgi:hypothetical protein
MKDLQREILNQVAAGTISAEEGASRLEDLDRTPQAAAETTVVRQVKLISRLGNAEIIGDASIASAVAEGPHNARQDGDTLVIEQSPLSDEAGFEFSRPQGRVIVNGFDFGRKLTVRVNPALPLAMTVQAGNLRVRGVAGPMSAQVQAGNCTIDDFRGPLQLEVAAGNVAATGSLTSGSSTIRCEMGSVRLNLDRKSDVRVKARATMGKVTLEGDAIKDGVVGSGTASLDVECTMGTIKVVAG